MNFFIKCFNKIRPWEFVIISLICGAIFGLLDFVLVLGCRISLNGNTLCSFFSYPSGIIHVGNLYGISSLQLLIMFVIILLLYNRIIFKREVTVWKTNQVIHFVMMSLFGFVLSCNFSDVILRSYTYDVKNGSNVFKNWIVDCKDRKLKTPFFVYDPNEGSDVKNRNLLFCTGRYTRNRLFDIFAHEIK